MRLVFCLFLVGCGDALVGTWQTNDDPNAPVDASVSYVGTFTFKADRTFTSRATTVYGAAATLATCTAEVEIDGAYVEGSGKLTLSPSSGSNQTTGCATSANNQSSPTLVPADAAAFATDFSYSVSGDQLRLTGPTFESDGTGLTYTKQ